LKVNATEFGLESPYKQIDFQLHIPELQHVLHLHRHTLHTWSPIPNLNTHIPPTRAPDYITHRIAVHMGH
jgi:hypothetical protein